MISLLFIVIRKSSIKNEKKNVNQTFGERRQVNIGK